MAPSTAASVQTRVGSVLKDKWVLGPVIGSGGTAAVYEGTHKTNGRRVAVKVLHSSLGAEVEVVARFKREGYIANRVGHPGAVSILDDDVTEDGAPFLVMDRLDGEPFTQILRRANGKLPPRDALRVARSVLDVLAVAHDQGITHRDVKPDNVFITTTGAVKLLDFGIARVKEHVLGWTQDGSAMGTPAYMSPEQARGRWNDVDATSDVWSVGAMMYRALTGKSTREGGTPQEQLLAAMTLAPPKVRDVAADVSRPIAAIVDRALSFEKKDRFQDARSMQAAIDGLSALDMIAGEASQRQLPDLSIDVELGDFAPTPTLSSARSPALATAPALVAVAVAPPTSPGSVAPVSFEQADEPPPHPRRRLGPMVGAIVGGIGIVIGGGLGYRAMTTGFGGSHLAASQGAIVHVDLTPPVDTTPVATTLPPPAIDVPPATSAAPAPSTDAPKPAPATPKKPPRRHRPGPAAAAPPPAADSDNPYVAPADPPASPASLLGRRQ